MVFMYLKCICRTQSGTFKEGNLLVNKDGVRIVSQSEVETVKYFSLSLYFYLAFVYFVSFELYIQHVLHLFYVFVFCFGFGCLDSNEMFSVTTGYLIFLKLPYLEGFENQNRVLFVWYKKNGILIKSL